MTAAPAGTVRRGQTLRGNQRRLIPQRAWGCAPLAESGDVGGRIRTRGLWAASMPTVGGGCPSPVGLVPASSKVGFMIAYVSSVVLLGVEPRPVRVEVSDKRVLMAIESSEFILPGRWAVVNRDESLPLIRRHVVEASAYRRQLVAAASGDNADSPVGGAQQAKERDRQAAGPHAHRPPSTFSDC